MLREFLVFLAYLLVTQLQGHMVREFLVVFAYLLILSTNL